MIGFEFTRDLELVRTIITNPKIYPCVSDDKSPSPEEFTPLESLLYVLVKDGDEVLGVWCFNSQNSICWEIHTCLLPSAYGARAIQAAAGLAEWIWKNTEWQRVITNVPECNRLALRFALKAGMTRFAVNPKSYLKNGNLIDQVMLGISRPGA